MNEFFNFFVIEWKTLLFSSRPPLSHSTKSCSCSNNIEFICVISFRIIIYIWVHNSFIINEIVFRLFLGAITIQKNLIFFTFVSEKSNWEHFVSWTKWDPCCVWNKKIMWTEIKFLCENFFFFFFMVSTVYAKLSIEYSQRWY